MVCFCKYGTCNIDRLERVTVFVWNRDGASDSKYWSKSGVGSGLGRKHWRVVCNGISTDVLHVWFLYVMGMAAVASAGNEHEHE